ncbi:hypothetical protein NP233_g3115 [Leucocoprinus birnbaumii]|uniref:Uncharacterized protein n=1 Tax=Leucocoprinus birnbaumii TaxID=56174 RepID=A0AAD5W3J7_9AGAR|nr:hypothetical protein NP233_g3115 [Leucocoprinus birnbaumii]
MDPGDIQLPAILDPILSFLADALPPSLYNFIMNFFSHCLALSSAIFNLVVALLSRSPTEWNAQTILPPLISLLAAYLALASIYRTTTWMIRTSFWVAKWGIIVGALAAGMGWFAGATQNGGIVAPGLIKHVGSLLLDTLNGRNRNAVGGERESRLGGSQSRRKSTQRPKPWESFDRHREWQYNEDRDQSEQGSELETLFNDLMSVAGQWFGGDNWWSTMMDGTNTDERSGARSNTNSKSRTR